MIMLNQAIKPEEKQARSYWLAKKFTDNKRFPYGFSRSGEFTIMEAERLENHGHLLYALMNDLVLDPTEEDEKFVQAVKDNIQNYNFDVKLWIKYLKSNRKIITPMSAINTSFADSENDDIYLDDDDCVDDED